MRLFSGTAKALMPEHMLLGKITVCFIYKLSFILNQTVKPLRTPTGIFIFKITVL